MGVLGSLLTHTQKTSTTIEPKILIIASFGAYARMRAKMNDATPRKQP